MDIFNNNEKYKMDEIYKITSILTKNEEGTLAEILKVACSVLEADTGIICNIKENQYRILESFSTEGSHSLKGVILNLKDTFCQFTIKENSVISVHDIRNSATYKAEPCCVNYGLGAYIGIPISFNDQDIGTLNFSSKKAKAQPYSSSDRNFVQYLGQWVSNYFDRLYFKKSIQDKNVLLEELHQESEQKNKELKEIMNEKNQLMQILVHDLKSPLSNIQMLSYLFQDFVTNKESEELINIFNKSLKDVFHLIEQMELLNSVENFPLNNFIEEFDLIKFLEENIKNFKNTAELKNIELHFNTQGKSFMIKSDQNFLNRIFNNLISNAIKFSPFGKNIYITLTSLENQFAISVKDEGPGIGQTDQEKLFKKFSTLSNNKPTNNESSSGLGLFIVKELVSHLNGEITLASKVGQGSTFTITLPAAFIAKS